MNSKIDLMRLKWTKNVNHPEPEKWSYSHNEVHYPCLVPEFNLHWKKGADSNISKLEEGDIILLRQRTKITHLVMVLDDKIQNDSTNGNHPLFRRVQVLWMAPEPWEKAPQQNGVFGFDIDLQGGKAMILDNITALAEEFKDRGGINAFQDRVAEQLGLGDSKLL
jgi:hypothetical protein